MKTSLAISLIVGLTIGLTYNTRSIALSSDRNQPAQIEADETEIDFKTGVRILTNNVLVVQGTLRVKADKLVATYKQGELVKAVADGSLARFKQRPDNEPDDVEGWAKKILVDYPNNTITLIGKAALKQGASTATGDKIIYNMSTDKLRIMKGSKIGIAGNGGSAAPARKLEDPFKDDIQSLAPASKPTTAASEDTDQETATEQAIEKIAEPSVVPVKAGRSRLILAPRKKPKADPLKPES